MIYIISLILFGISMSKGCQYRDPQHTLCRYQAAACPGKSLLRSGGLGCTEKQLILDVHNQLRQSVALGHVTSQPPAIGMREMVWDEELAGLAQRWADQCNVGHDSQRTLPRFPVGQNVAATWTFENPSPKGPGPDFKRQIEEWFGEVMKWGFRRDDVDHFHFSERTGHYTQLVWSDTYLIGCGYSYFKDPQRGHTKLYVCNYGPGGNVIGEHLYQTGPPTCSSDTNLSPSRRYSGLCEVKGSNPPGMYCSAHDALYATQGAYHSNTLQPAAPRPHQNYYQAPMLPPPPPAPPRPIFTQQANYYHQPSSTALQPRPSPSFSPPPSSPSVNRFQQPFNSHRTSTHFNTHQYQSNSLFTHAFFGK